MKANILKDEKGIALVVAILLLLVVTLIGISGVNLATFDNMIAGNKRASDQAFYVAEAGINEFLGRFRPGATSEITDNFPSSTTWRLRLSTTGGQGANSFGQAPDPAKLQTESSLQTQMDFGVEVRHKLDAAGNVAFSGDSPIYIARSHGFTADGGYKVIEVEISKRPNLDPPAALYAENPVNIRGSSTYIEGNDRCGGGINKPGVASTLPVTNSNAVETKGNPTILGNPAIKYSIPNLDLAGSIAYLKGFANYTYNYSQNQTLAGQSWGTPTFPTGTSVADQTSTPLQYSGSPNFVYFNMQGNRTIKLTGGTSGAGILLVDGNLELSGGFTWYGIIIVTGALDYTGGGQKNVTGGIIAGEAATIEIDVQGNAGILYCSSVARWLSDEGNISPQRLTRWKEEF